jgi:stearoyl-CoA desaturase (delta-9 desaturase)
VQYFYGLLDLNFLGYFVVTLCMAQFSLMGITLYLHRDQAHRSVDLHPALRHIFRLWIWMTSGAITREWVAVHRKHHAMCEREGDPHSPRVFGLKRVLLEGSELYRAEAGNPATVEKYSRGCPEDWLENQLYSKYSYLGIAMLVVMDLVLFGIPGIIILSIQLATMPVLAAGGINGIGHAWGYRNFETDDASTNIVPWGVLVGGEELHNNHHAFPSSARFSMRPWEFDIGWFYLRVFSLLRLAKIRRVAPEIKVENAVSVPDLETLRAVVVNRMHVLRHYSRQVTLPILKDELTALGEKSLVRKARQLIATQPAMLDDLSREKLAELVERYPTLRTVMEFRAELKTLWEGANVSNERLLNELKEWCARAEASGIEVLEEFAATLRGYRLAAPA